ncbi:MAG: hypothetical protein LJE84_04595 [Gammaproteobacteria bacterium]|nr:hypothetical protein [Gammaproteobacteria bacterium]
MANRNPSQLAPIAVFVYRRPRHLERVLDGLRANAEFSGSSCYFFCDGAAGSEDAPAVQAARDVVRAAGLANATIIESDEHRGLAASVSGGVGQLCASHGRVIVLEDDLVPGPFFLEFMNHALQIYEPAEHIMQIGAYMYPVVLPHSPEAFFLPFTSSWGWATWQRAWQHFDATGDGYELLARDAQKRREFDLDGAVRYFQMLRAQRQGKIDSWAICWYLNVFLRGGLTLFPRQTLVENLGEDGSGTHGVVRGAVARTGDPNFRVREFPGPEAQPDADACRRLCVHLARSNRIDARVWARLKWYLWERTRAFA